VSTRKRFREVGLNFRIPKRESGQFIRGSTFEIDIEERVNAITGDYQSAMLFEWTKHSSYSERRYQGWALGEHLIAEREMVRTLDHHLPPFSGGQFIEDRFHFVFHGVGLWSALFSVVAENQEEGLMEALLNNTSEGYAIDVDSCSASRIVVTELGSSCSPE
jgi:hypothetical protein